MEKASDYDYASNHPWDSHKPNYSRLLPESIRPYPSFEGWYTRVTDYSKQFSAAVIVATNYATDESQVTLLFNSSSPATECLATITKGAKLTAVIPRSGDDGGDKPKGFQWEAKGLAKMAMWPLESEVEVEFENYKLKIETNIFQFPWDARNSYNGPEGWVRKVRYFPCHWHIHTLGSQATYTFTDKTQNKTFSGTGFVHQEKNWGTSFPGGHVWLQGISSDNTQHLVCSAARFRLFNLVNTPFVVTLGYRSKSMNLDMRITQIATFFTVLYMNPLEGKFCLTAVSPSHTVKITSRAPPESFSKPIYAPIGKIEWKPDCVESFVATIEVEVYKHILWGLIGREKLVEKQVMEYGALEFGEDQMPMVNKDKTLSKSVLTTSGVLLIFLVLALAYLVSLWFRS